MIVSFNVRSLETVFFKCYLLIQIKTILSFFSNQHSKTECTVKSFGLTATCIWITSSVQGVHHAGMAVELGHLLKSKKMQKPNLFVVRVLQLCEMGSEFGFYIVGSFPMEHVGASRIFHINIVRSLVAFNRQSSSIIYMQNCCWIKPRIIIYMRLFDINKLVDHIDGIMAHSLVILVEQYFGLRL